MIPKEILAQVRRIQIVSGKLVNDLFAGEYHSVFKGRGMEFDEVREYQAGDDVRAIDWNVTARMGHPYLKSFVEERELTVMLLVDASSSGRFGTTTKLKKEVAAEFCAVLAFSAIRNHDKVGLILFTDRVEKFVPPKKGKRHVLRVIRELLYFEPESRKTDLRVALELLNQVTHRRTVTFLVSDFLTEGFERDLRISARRHDLIAVPLGDPREATMPPIGLVELEDAETGERVVVDTGSRAFRESFAAASESARAGRRNLFRSIGVDLIEVDTARPYLQSLHRFFRDRERRR